MTYFLFSLQIPSSVCFPSIYFHYLLWFCILFFFLNSVCLLFLVYFMLSVLHVIHPSYGRGLVKSLLFTMKSWVWFHMGIMCDIYCWCPSHDIVKVLLKVAEQIYSLIHWSYSDVTDITDILYFMCFSYMFMYISFPPYRDLKMENIMLDEKKKNIKICGKWTLDRWYTK